MAVSEADLLFATQIAYADFDRVLLSDEVKNKCELTIGEAIKIAYKKKIHLWDDFENYVIFVEDKTTGEEIPVLKDEFKHIANWTIISAQNDNKIGGTGFYGCILDTGSERILACRGSESMQSQLNWDQDWYKADLKLLNSTQTVQDQALKNYMLQNKNLLSEKPWYATGHSLGGSLADHAAIISFEDSIPNFIGSESFDGPGRSLEYMEEHKDAIESSASRMKHVKASVIGSLLFDIPGVETKFIQVSDVSRLSNRDGEYRASHDTTIDAFRRHSTIYWVIDENDNLQEGEQGLLPILAEKFSRGMDRLPSFVGNTLIEVVNFGVSAYFKIDEYFEESPEFKSDVIVAVVCFILNHPQIIGIALKTVAILIVAVGIIILAEFVIEVMEKFAEYIAEAVCASVKWLHDKATELYDFIKEEINAIRSWFDNKFNKGTKYAEANPYFKADTDMLNAYASRLAGVNSRLKSLDGGMRSLYWQVGFLDLWDILCANLITSESYSLNRAIYYLTDTAERLSSADSKARAYLEG